MHSIREYTHNDVDGIKKVLIELQDFERMMDPDRLAGLEIAHMYLEHLLKLCQQEKGKIFVVEIQNEVVGMISVYIEDDPKHMRKSAQFAYISDLMVLPEYRDEGVTKELLEKAEIYAKSKHVKIIQSYVLSDHKDSLNSYLRNGFHQHEFIVRKRI